MRTLIGEGTDHIESTAALAAAYVRMSTEHQQYSTENQLDTIRLYAVTHGLEVIKVYTDAGKSGQRLEGRDALKQLFFDVETGLAQYATVLVYDVSRWGRFQDPDVRASYEVRCRQAGVSVQNCAEQFTNDGSSVSNIVKSVKRMMAGEYSRELSVKVFAGQSRSIEMGYRQDSMNQQIEIEDQLRKGKKIAIAEREIAPYKPPFDNAVSAIRVEKVRDAQLQHPVPTSRVELDRAFGIALITPERPGTRGRKATGG